MKYTSGSQWCLAMFTLLVGISAQALPTKEVMFEKGSNCGHYEGNLTSGALFLVEMNAANQLIIHTDGHVQSVTDSKGHILEDKGGANYCYQSLSTGTHSVKMVGREQTEVEFCVY